MNLFQLQLILSGLNQGSYVGKLNVNGKAYFLNRDFELYFE